jgi:hypothetical protein
MPIKSFSGITYVAFSDLNGFKEMMRNHENAANALDKFYKTIYRLKSKTAYSGMSTLAVSDCAISFIDNANNRDSLPSILGFLKELHTEMIKAEYLVTSSVAYGQFYYNERVELTGLEKNMLFGGAYLKAYINNGKCPEGSIVIICDETDKDLILQASGEYRELFRDYRRGVKGLQFFWAVSSADGIADFEKSYHDTYTLKYKGMIAVYKEYSGREET